MSMMASVANSVMAGLGAIGSMNSQIATLKSQESSAKANAAVEMQNADSALAVANVNEEKQRQGARQVMGEQRAAMAQAGTSLLSSTNQNLAVQSAKAAEADALNIRYGGLTQAHAYRTQAQSDLWQAQFSKEQLAPTYEMGWLNHFYSSFNAYMGTQGANLGYKPGGGSDFGMGSGGMTGGFAGIAGGGTGGGP